MAQENDFMSKTRVNIETDFGSLAAAGLITVSLIIMQAFIALGNLSIAQFVSLLAFAIALPFLVLQLLMEHVLKKLKFEVPSRLRVGVVFTHIFAMLMAIIGVAAALWSVSWILGVVFTASAAIAEIIYELSIKEVKEVIKVEEAQANVNKGATGIVKAKTVQVGPNEENSIVNAVSVIGSLRAVDYGGVPPSAVSELVDNSVEAKVRRAELTAGHKGTNFSLLHEIRHYTADGINKANNRSKNRKERRNGK